MTLRSMFSYFNLPPVIGLKCMKNMCTYFDLLKKLRYREKRLKKKDNNKNISDIITMTYYFSITADRGNLDEINFCYYYYLFVIAVHTIIGIIQNVQ